MFKTIKKLFFKSKLTLIEKHIETLKREIKDKYNFVKYCKEQISFYNILLTKCGDNEANDYQSEIDSFNRWIPNNYKEIEKLNLMIKQLES